MLTTARLGYLAVTVTVRWPTSCSTLALRDTTAAANGSNRIVLSCPRSADIDALTCLNDLY
jgi:hypothetical protein